MSASVAGFTGLLLNHKPFLDRCNITHGPLTDAWGHSVITNRKQFKTIMRQMYGSQLSASEMWKAMKIPYTAEEVIAFDHEMKEGDIAPAIAFKDFIINNCNPQPTMNLKIAGETCYVECNKHHNVGEKTTIFDLYDSEKGIRRIHNTSIKQVPDLHSFRKFMVTGLIHGIDSQVIDQAVEAVYDIYQWILSIHDAMILCCEAADDARDYYCYGQNKESISLKYIHENRITILSEYFTSIGIKPSAIKLWKENVEPHIEKLEEPLDINPMVLK